MGTEAKRSPILSSLPKVIVGTVEIAVALAHSEKPSILQAVDNAWWNFRDALRQNGVTIDFICEDDVRSMLIA